MREPKTPEEVAYVNEVKSLVDWYSKLGKAMGGVGLPVTESACRNLAEGFKFGRLSVNAPVFEVEFLLLGGGLFRVGLADPS